mmetsp:Transcript_13460/g.24362  ORF Transcript_13460/g.24362 Transcript_13460/m.24362 type:complete len:129 (+) Transcript_13460:156-542(+)
MSVSFHVLVISTEMDTSMNALEKRPNAQNLQKDENGYQEMLPRQEERPKSLSCNHEGAGRNLLHPKTRVAFRLAGYKLTLNSVITTVEGKQDSNASSPVSFAPWFLKLFVVFIVCRNCTSQLPLSSSS